MMRIPFAFLPPAILQKLGRNFLIAGDFLKRFFPWLSISIQQAELPTSDREYLSMCFIADVFLYGVLVFVSYMVLAKIAVANTLLISLGIPLLICMFILFMQANYPRSIIIKRIHGIDKNLLPAMQNFLVQINSGVPIFNALVNLSKGEYGELSSEMAKAVREINAGLPEVAALEDMARKNPSMLFRGALWQIVNGMKTGANLSTVIQEIIGVIADQQALQIQRYGATLNPLAMFYMLLAVIVPSLGMTFLVIISSLISFGEETTKLVFWSLFGFVCLVQIMFLGVISGKRPSLLGGN